MQRGRGVDAGHQADGGHRQPDAIPPLVVVDAMAADGKHGDAADRGEAEHGGREPRRQTATGRGIERGEVLFAEPADTPFDVGVQRKHQRDGRQSAQHADRQGPNSLGDQVGDPRLVFHQRRIGVGPVGQRRRAATPARRWFGGGLGRGRGVSARILLKHTTPPLVGLSAPTKFHNAFRLPLGDTFRHRRSKNRLSPNNPQSRGP